VLDRENIDYDASGLFAFRNIEGSAMGLLKEQVDPYGV
jgi:hypothetical protein